MLFSVSGCLLAMSCLLFFLLSLKLNFVFEINDYFYMTTMVMGGFSTFFAVIISGQRSEDIVKELIDRCSTGVYILMIF